VVEHPAEGLPLAGRPARAPLQLPPRGAQHRAEEARHRPRSEKEGVGILFRTRRGVRLSVRGEHTRLPLSRTAFGLAAFSFALRRLVRRRLGEDREPELATGQRPAHLFFEPAHRYPRGPPDPSGTGAVAHQRHRDERVGLHPGEPALAVGDEQLRTAPPRALESEQRPGLARGHPQGLADVAREIGVAPTAEPPVLRHREERRRDLGVEPLLAGDGPAQAGVELEGIGVLQAQGQRLHERRQLPRAGRALVEHAHVCPPPDCGGSCGNPGSGRTTSESSCRHGRANGISRIVPPPGYRPLSGFILVCQRAQNGRRRWPATKKARPGYNRTGPRLPPYRLMGKGRFGRECGLRKTMTWAMSSSSLSFDPRLRRFPSIGIHTTANRQIHPPFG
jgi:hypothetical protein